MRSTRAGMMVDGKIPIDKFDGTDYGLWKMQIEDFLFDKDLCRSISKKLAGVNGKGVKAIG